MDLSSKKVTVIGGGKIASRRVRSLLEFAGQITVIAPAVLPELEQLAENGQILWKRKEYERTDLCGSDMVLACTNEAQVNEDVSRTCRQQGILVNTASDRQQCDFYFPGLLCEEEVVIGFCGGGNPVKAKEMRRKVEMLLHGDKPCMPGNGENDE